MQHESYPQIILPPNPQSRECIRGFTQLGFAAQCIKKFTNTGLTANTTYYYKIVALGADNSQAPSQTVIGKTKLTDTPEPTKPTLPTTPHK